MLNITRTWNAIGAAYGMRRPVALAIDYARRRKAFGRPLNEMPLHVDTLAEMVAESEGAFLLAFRVVELLGRAEAGMATPSEELGLRLITTLAKLTTGKQVVSVTSEALECFGGAGYVNDTGLPTLLADAQVLSIWEGTTNVLSLDSLKVLRQDGIWGAYLDETGRLLAAAKDTRLKEAARRARAAVEHAGRWLQSAVEDRPALEAGARRFAMTLGRTLELALLVEHAQWCLDQGKGKGERALAVANRYARSRIDLIEDEGTLAESQSMI
jgi:hypothetical protein